MSRARERSSREVLLELDRTSRRPLRAQLEDGLRRAIRDHWLAPGSRLPSTRALATDLGVSRRLVVEAYEQLAAEGYLVTRSGSGTRVAVTRHSAAVTPTAEPEERLRYDFRAGVPDLSIFPRAAWSRALREVVRNAPDHEFGYPDPHGATRLRQALADYLPRVRGVVADEGRVIVCLGYSHGLWLVGQALGGAGQKVALEDPGNPTAYTALRMSGVETVPIPVDEDGLDVDALHASGATAVVVTPAHQFPSGVPLSARRRADLLRWTEQGGVVIEDDYDAEFRYDRAPLGALQGLAPEQVIYAGSCTKTLAPALRLGWLVVPARLIAPIAEPNGLVTRGAPNIEQLALAEMIETAAYDQHLRSARRTYRRRRDALVSALGSSRLRVEGVAAGLHAVVRLPEGVDAVEASEAAARRSVAVAPMSRYQADPADGHDALVLGYASVGEAAIYPGVAALLSALSDNVS